MVNYSFRSIIKLKWLYDKKKLNSKVAKHPWLTKIIYSDCFIHFLFLLKQLYIETEISTTQLILKCAAFRFQLITVPWQKFS